MRISLSSVVVVLLLAVATAASSSDSATKTHQSQSSDTTRNSRHLEARNTSSEVKLCPLGHWCTNGLSQPCPSGTYGDSHSLSDDSCSGTCGLFWTSEPGSIACQTLSTEGVVAVVFIVLAIVSGVMGGTLCISTKAIQNQWFGRLLPQDDEDDDLQQQPQQQQQDVSIDAEVREIIQKQIRSGVDALASRIVHQSFPSILSLTSTMLQFNLGTSEQVNSGIKTAKAELTENIKHALLQHPRLRFDDRTYPANRPLWAEVDPTSDDGSTQIHAASNVISVAIRTAVENDLLEWFRRQQQGEEPVGEESQQALLSDAASSVPSQWPRVDSELQILLRTVLANPSCFKCTTGFRFFYSNPSLRPLLMNVLLAVVRLGLDALVLVACFLVIFGGSLLSLEIPFDAGSNNLVLHQEFDHYYFSLPPDYYPFRISVNWEGFHLPTLKHVWGGYSFTYTRDTSQFRDVDLFRPVIDQCVEYYGFIYRGLLIFICMCFCIVTLPSLIRFCKSILQLAPCRRGTRESQTSEEQVTFTDCLQFIFPSVFQNGREEWLPEALLVAIRLLGTSLLVGAIAFYACGCIARLNHSSVAVEIPQSAAPTSINVQYSVVMQGAFIMSISAASFALTTAALAMHKFFRKRQRVIDRINAQAVQRQRQLAASVHVVEMRSVVVLPAAARLNPASAASSSSSQQSVAVQPTVAKSADDAQENKEHAVTFHAQAENSISADASSSSSSSSDESSDDTDSQTDSDSEEAEATSQADDVRQESALSPPSAESSSVLLSPSPGAPNETAVETEGTLASAGTNFEN